MARIDDLSIGTPAVRQSGAAPRVFTPTIRPRRSSAGAEAQGVADALGSILPSLGLALQKFTEVHEQEGRTEATAAVRQADPETLAQLVKLSKSEAAEFAKQNELGIRPDMVGYAQAQAADRIVFEQYPAFMADQDFANQVVNEMDDDRALDLVRQREREFIQEAFGAGEGIFGVEAAAQRMAQMSPQVFRNYASMRQDAVRSRNNEELLLRGEEDGFTAAIRTLGSDFGPEDNPEEAFRGVWDQWTEKLRASHAVGLDQQTALTATFLNRFATTLQTQYGTDAAIAFLADIQDNGKMPGGAPLNAGALGEAVDEILNAVFRRSSRDVGFESRMKRKQVEDVNQAVEIWIAEEGVKLELVGRNEADARDIVFDSMMKDPAIRDLAAEDASAMNLIRANALNVVEAVRAANSMDYEQAQEEVRRMLWYDVPRAKMFAQHWGIELPQIKELENQVNQTTDLLMQDFNLPLAAKVQMMGFVQKHIEDIMFNPDVIPLSFAEKQTLIAKRVQELKGTDGFQRELQLALHFENPVGLLAEPEPAATLATFKLEAKNAVGARFEALAEEAKALGDQVSPKETRRQAVLQQTVDAVISRGINTLSHKFMEEYASGNLTNMGPVRSSTDLSLVFNDWLLKDRGGGQSYLALLRSAAVDGALIGQGKDLFTFESVELRKRQNLEEKDFDQFFSEKTGAASRHYMTGNNKQVKTGAYDASTLKSDFGVRVDEQFDELLDWRRDQLEDLPEAYRAAPGFAPGLTQAQVDVGVLSLGLQGADPGSFKIDPRASNLSGAVGLLRSRGAEEFASPWSRTLNPREAREMLKSALHASGITAEELLAGRTHEGIPIKDLWTNPRDQINWAVVPMFRSEEELDAAAFALDGEGDSAWVELMRSYGYSDDLMKGLLKEQNALFQKLQEAGVQPNQRWSEAAGANKDPFRPLIESEARLGS